MRLFIYFSADTSNWWASSLRTYNGLPDPNKAQLQYSSGAPYFRTSRGSEWAGDIFLTSNPDQPGGEIHLHNVRLKAFR